MEVQKRNNRYVGKCGEVMAGKFLASRGYIILERNFSTPFGEIDLIAKKDGILVFFEVKTRRSDRFGPALDAITKIKQVHIIRNCKYYLSKKDLHDSPCRIDIIGIKLNKEEKLEVLRHVINAIEIQPWGQGAWVKGYQNGSKYYGK